jgi:hypothetical protein
MAMHDASMEDVFEQQIVHRMTHDAHGSSQLLSKAPVRLEGQHVDWAVKRSSARSAGACRQAPTESLVRRLEMAESLSGHERSRTWVDQDASRTTSGSPAETPQAASAPAPAPPQQPLRDASVPDRLPAAHEITSVRWCISFVHGALKASTDSKDSVKHVLVSSCTMLFY